MTTINQPAIFFHPDAIESEGKELVGRRSSGQSFLKGFLNHMPGETVRCATSTAQAAKTFEQTVRDMGETRRIENHILRGRDDFTKAGAIFFPGPGYLDAAWRRLRFDPTACSLIGITHTVSTRRIMEGLHAQMSEPVEEWDAIICTSRAVQSVVRQQFELEGEYFRRRFGATRVPMPQLPLIPLGIHAADFSRTDAGRAKMRKRFNAPDDAVVVMTMGRLTSVEKANPVPMYIALEKAAKETGKPVHLWMVGWSNRPQEDELHARGAKELCPSVTVTFVDGLDAEIRRDVWSGADIFTLAVDNIQETFGLVPVEAMAAGLPVVMPDWSGFRDTVVHGETGYLIPTMTPRAGNGGSIASRFADGTDGYLHYLSIVQQQTVIDITAYTAAFVSLINDPDKRKTMGNAGTRRASVTFDWKAIIPQYLELTASLAEHRRGATPMTSRLRRDAPSPLEIDPYSLFKDYPSHSASAKMRVTGIRPLDAQGLVALDQMNGRKLYNRKIIDDAKLMRIAAFSLQSDAETCEELARKVGLPLGTVMSGVLFLAKFDFVKIDESGVQNA